MVNGRLQPPVAGETSDHKALLAALSCHRSNPCQGAQGVVVSGLQRLRCLGEQCGENNSADSRPGAKDCHVALLTSLPRGALLVLRRELGAEVVQSSVSFFDLL